MNFKLFFFFFFISKCSLCTSYIRYIKHLEIISVGLRGFKAVALVIFHQSSNNFAHTDTYIATIHIITECGNPPSCSLSSFSLAAVLYQK